MLFSVVGLPWCYPKELKRKTHFPVFTGLVILITHISGHLNKFKVDKKTLFCHYGTYINNTEYYRPSIVIQMMECIPLTSSADRVAVSSQL